jgi:hypothetical protein
MRLRRIAVIDRIEFGAAIVFGAGALIALGGIEGRCGRDESDARLPKRLPQALERRFDISI